MRNYYLDETDNIHIQPLINSIHEKNWLITTKKGKGKLPLFCGNGERVINIYSPNKTVQTCQAKIGDNETIMHFWRPLIYLSNTMSRNLPTKSTSGVNFIYPKLRYWVVVKEDDKILCHEKGVYINTNRDHLYRN